MLGCHISNVPKLVARGKLTSTGKRGRSFSRDQVEDLARRRAAEREARKARPPRRYQRVDYRPDPDHEWLTISQVAARSSGSRGPLWSGVSTATDCRRSETAGGYGSGGTSSNRWRQLDLHARQGGRKAVRARCVQMTQVCTSQPAGADPAHRNTTGCLATMSCGKARPPCRPALPWRCGRSLPHPRAGRRRARYQQGPGVRAAPS